MWRFSEGERKSKKKRGVKREEREEKKANFDGLEKKAGDVVVLPGSW